LKAEENGSPDRSAGLVGCHPMPLSGVGWLGVSCWAIEHWPERVELVALGDFTPLARGAHPRCK